MAQNKITRPELFFCLAGPVGVDLDAINQRFETQLQQYNYKAVHIHITELLPLIKESLGGPFDTLAERYDRLISGANELRKSLDDDRLMAILSLFQIRAERAKLAEQRDGRAEGDRPGIAYIIRQLKRPEEIRFYRQLYGKQVFQVSVWADPEQRRSRLARKMRDHDRTKTRAIDFAPSALELVNRDESETALLHGQRVVDVFPLADVFIDATSNETISKTTERFLRLVFGHNFHSPTREEYGMYIAKSASLRSVDLSRQVGAAVFSKSGEIRVLGCNEVPSPFGGTYWEGDQGDAREFVTGADTNDEFKHRIFGDIIRKLCEADLLPKEYAKLGSREFIAKVEHEKGVDLNRKLLMMDIIEYGRIIHAEMNAITDAARKGVSLDGTTLFCTTFPCHLCAKHIISSGIDRVVYIEPYPKSYAHELYRDDIVLTRQDTPQKGKVSFEPFIGIAPFRYRDLFEKNRRKDTTGVAMEWQAKIPLPCLEVYGDSYVADEVNHLKELIAKFADKKVMLPGSMLEGIMETPHPTAEQATESPPGRKRRSATRMVKGKPRLPNSRTK
ncbi:MAG: anti-phage dCTP deaminase [Phreatobacter sp.]|uniref:anti-phage dCTP deaminase n=1 Tax=Phreatobacter sp. TaxID=1966341 RepID=UPI002734E095|nr:anti-phage dCTP deaminase [Phreatobacter sp.]MDP2803920.1 anti-phage dCTP deaminase [Phreatobacter sp.]